MGKKKVIKKTKEELLKEREKLDSVMRKEVKLKNPQKIKEGRIYISSSYNNVILTLTNSQGNVLAWNSSGQLGFKGRKKATPFAASKVAEALCQTANQLGIERVEILVRGIGSGRESALRSIAARGLELILVKDVTPIPHNGCRPRKVRRV